MSWGLASLGAEQLPLTAWDPDWTKLQALGPYVYETALMIPFMAPALGISAADATYSLLVLQVTGYADIMRSLYGLEFNAKKILPEMQGLADFNAPWYQAAGKSYTWFNHLFKATEARRTLYKAQAAEQVAKLTPEALAAIVAGQPGWTAAQQQQAKVLYEQAIAKAKAAPAKKADMSMVALALVVLVVIVLGAK